MTSKKLLLASALSGVLANLASQNADAQTAVTQEVEKCFGIQKGKGLNTCSISKEEIKAANLAFKNKFKKSDLYDCAANVSGSAKAGYLGWVYVAAGSCLKIDGGFLIQKKYSDWQVRSRKIKAEIGA